MSLAGYPAGIFLPLNHATGGQFVCYFLRNKECNQTYSILYK